MLGVPGDVSVTGDADDLDLFQSGFIPITRSEIPLIVDMNCLCWDIKVGSITLLMIFGPVGSFQYH